MKKGPVTPKGFRDISPELAKKRRVAINKIAEVLEDFGFVPIETPTIEFKDTLLGKYGEDEKLIYQFTDRGGRELAMRYDFTVPLARFVANNLELLSPTFSRYQVGQVFRGEKPQKGRFREFTQMDFDIVGDSGAVEDARIIAAAIKSARTLGLKAAKMAVNDRENFKDFSVEQIRAIDKIHKQGEGVVNNEVIERVKRLKPTSRLREVFAILEDDYSLREGRDYFFDSTLARGLDYYTGVIFELKPNGKPEELSIGGGGRYDKLIGMFAGRDIPAVGFSFGLARLLEEIS